MPMQFSVSLSLEPVPAKSTDFHSGSSLGICELRSGPSDGVCSLLKCVFVNEVLIFNIGLLTTCPVRGSLRGPSMCLAVLDLVAPVSAQDS